VSRIKKLIHTIALFCVFWDLEVLEGEKWQKKPTIKNIFQEMKWGAQNDRQVGGRKKVIHLDTFK
jgi:hypothetical protein